MALAQLVYPGAVHTRLHHSLGAYHLMCNAITELKDKGINITDAEAQAAKAAILLHDIGHGPFSHALENVILKDPVSRFELKSIYNTADYLFLHLNDYSAFKKVLPSKIFELATYPKTIIAGVSGYSADFIKKEIKF